MKKLKIHNIIFIYARGTIILQVVLISVCVWKLKTQLGEESNKNLVFIKIKSNQAWNYDQLSTKTVHLILFTFTLLFFSVFEDLPLFLNWMTARIEC